MPNTLTFQAKIIKPNLENLEEPSVYFKFKYTDALGTCVIYEEEFTSVVMTGSKGLVSLELGAGVKTYPPAPVTLYDVFNFGSALSCQGGIPAPTVTPIAAERRKVIVEFNDGSGMQTLPIMNLNSVPFALHATMSNNSNQLAGLSANQYTKVSDITAAGCVAGQALRYTGTSFVCENITGAGVATVTATAPVVSTGGANPNISMAKANATTNGYLSSGDWSVFSSKLSNFSTMSSSDVTTALGFTPLNRTSNLSDLASVATARTNLGLGTVAVLNVAASGDATATEVVKGNDSRLTGAVQGSTNLSGDVTGTVSTTVVANVGGVSATNIAAGANLSNAATSANTASAIVRRSASGDFTAGVINATTFSGTNTSATNVSTQNVYLYDGTNTNRILFKAPASGITNYTLTLPPAVGTSGQVLATNASGDLSWINASSGSVTSVAATAPLASSGGTTPSISITRSSGTVDGYLASTDFTIFNNKLGTTTVFSGDVTGTYNSTVLANSGVTAGTYAGAVTVDAKGRVTAGTASLDLTSGVTGILPITNGGTNASAFTNTYGVSYFDGTRLVTSSAGAANQFMVQTVAGPVWTTATFPSTTTANQLLYSSANNTVAGLATANSAILTTSSSGVPAWSIISNDTFTQYALLAGRAGGQTINGGTLASQDLTLESTANATKGNIILNPSGGNVGIGTINPGARLTILTGAAGVIGQSIQAAASQTANVFEIKNSAGVVQFAINLGAAGVTGTDNTSLGASAGVVLTSGINNTFVGKDSGSKTEIGSFNTGVGKGSLSNNISGGVNTAVGDSALRDNTGDNNTAIGAGALKVKTSGDSNTAVGANALAANTTASSNTALGDFALRYTTTGASNVAIGHAAGATSTVGNNNVFIGTMAGNATSGSGNLFLGHYAGANETGSNKLYIANSNTATPLIYGDFSGGSVGIGTTAPGTSLDVSGAITTRPFGTGSGQTGQLVLRELAANGTSTVIIKAADNISGDVSFTLPSADGTAGQVMSTNGSGILSWVAAAGGSVTSVTATAPLSSTGGTTPALSITRSSASVDGYLASSDFTTFNNKLSPSTVFSGDVSGTSSTMSVDKIKGSSINFAIPIAANNYLRYNGTDWVNSNILSTDVTTSLGYTPAPTATTIAGYGITDAVRNGGQAGAVTAGPSDASALTLQTSGASRVTVLASGDVGIGTALPNEQLEITGNMRIPVTSSTVGAIKQGANTLLHTYGVNNLFVGNSAGNLTMIGLNTTAVGYQAGRSITSGNHNTMTGDRAGYSTTTGGWNSFYGQSAGYFNVNGDYNSFFGRNAGEVNTSGSSNAFFGHMAGARNTTGANNTFIGKNAGNTDGTVSTPANLTNASAIGYNAQVTTNNSLVLGGAGAFAVNVGIGTTAPGAALDVKGAIRMSGATSGYAGFKPAAAAGSTVWTLPVADGTSGQVLATNGSGDLTWSSSAVGSVTSVAATAPLASSGGTTPSISITRSSGTVDGYLASTDFTIFNNKLGTTTAFSGDVTGTYNSTVLANSGVTAGTYAGAVTVDAKGRVTAGVASLDLTSGVTGILPVANGGTNASAFTNTYGVSYFDGTRLVTSTAGAANQFMVQTVAGPVWTTATFPSTTTANQLLYSSANNTVAGLVTANSAVLTTSAVGVPSWSLISNDTYTQYALLAGRDSGGVGQTLNGGTLASQDLTLNSTSHVTKGNIILNPNGGNVGIGTASPVTTLDIIKGGSSGAPATSGSVQSAGHRIRMGGSGNAVLDMGTNGSDGAWFQSTHLGSLAINYPLLLNPNGGNVGIGTTSPSSPLSVTPVQYNTGTASQSLTTVTGVGTVWTSAMVGSQFVFANGVSAGTVTAFGSATSLTVTSSQTVAAQAYSISYTGLQVAASGNVGIGVTGPQAALDVVSTGTSSAIIVPRATTTDRPTTLVNGMIRYNTTTALFEFYQNGAWVNYTTVSDGRLKTNVTPLNRGLNIVNQLNPVFFDWDKNNPRAQGFGTQHQVGFIAQEVEKVLPEVVNKGEDSYRSVEYGKIVSVVVAAVKELYAKVMGHDVTIQTLDRDIASVNAKLEADNAAKDKKIKELEQRLEKIEKALNSK